MSEDFIKLECPSCGDTLQLSSNDYDNLFIEISGLTIFTGFNGNNTYTCPSCTSVFEKRQEFKKMSDSFGSVFNQSGQTVYGQQVNINTNGGTVIRGNLRVGGDFVGGDIIIGDKVMGRK